MDDSVYYGAIFLKHLLPALYDLRNNTSDNLLDRYKAIKNAADRSLALSASGSIWSAALGRSCFPSSEQIVESSRTRDDLTEILLTPDTSSTDFLSRDCAEIMSARSMSIMTAIKEQFLSLHSVFEKEKRRLKCDKQTYSVPIRFNGHESISKSYSSKIIVKRRRCRKSALLKRKLTLGSHEKVVLFNKLKRTFVKFQARSALKERMATLQRIIPGGNLMANDHLVRETADYIKFLACQVDVLTSLVVIAEGGATGA
ncbi:hypothetical protein O6H91_05G017200 [Diphasiastrum complanatum]|nr:hypothetical protein O6H91_05G017200 [Diphasiastrum complanatum]